MTTRVQDAFASLKAALLTVEALDQRVYGPGVTVTGVGAVIGMPTVRWGSFGGSVPTEASFDVHLLVPFDEYAPDRLLDLVELLVTAIEADPMFTVASASPGLFPQGSAQLPTYALTVDVGL